MFRLVIVATLLAVTNGKTIPHSNIEGRIVGGSNTTIEKYPYQLSLEILSLDGMHVCGGSLLKPNVVLTAAHCTNYYKMRDLRIRAGTTIRENGGETANVINVCQHPKFSPNTIDCDISVLILDRDLTLGSNIQTIALQQPSDDDIPDGTQGTATGWGALYNGGPSPSQLQELDVYHVGDDTCKELWSSPSGTSVNENMICFGNSKGGKGICNRDSGGPLVVDGKQVGVVSFGPLDCADPIIPAVYAKVHSKDITDHINKCLANL